MKLEVGKKYRGLINGIVFKVVRQYTEKEPIWRNRKYCSNIWYEIQTDDGHKLHHSKYFMEHLLIDEV